MWKEWTKLIFGEHEFIMFSVCVIFTFEISFWGINSLLYFIENSKSFDHLRLQPEKQKITQQPKTVEKILKLIVKHQISTILGVPVLYFLFNLRGNVLLMEDLPSMLTIFSQLLLFIFIEDALFFWIHYLLHQPYLMK
jgi:sterol desaturase/sphingolipid hydroxylase (fatty acid hydroxylase superfamily)